MRAQPKRPSIIVLGHWMVDRILLLPPKLLLANSLPREHINTPLLVRPGGSGYHFSVAARLAGFRPVEAPIIVGHDEAGRQVVKAAREAGISIKVKLSKKSTAEAILIYDCRHRRASFGTREANLELPDFAEQVISDSPRRSIFVAGHVLEDRTGRSKVLALLRRWKVASHFVVLDVVPHHLQSLISDTTRRALRRSASGVIGTRPALLPLLDSSSLRSHDDQEIVDKLLDHFEWVCMHPTNEVLVIGSRTTTNRRVYQVPTNWASFSVKAGVIDHAVAKELMRHVLCRKHPGRRVPFE